MRLVVILYNISLSRIYIFFLFIRNIPSFFAGCYSLQNLYIFLLIYNINLNHLDITTEIHKLQFLFYNFHTLVFIYSTRKFKRRGIYRHVKYYKTLNYHIQIMRLFYMFFFCISAAAKTQQEQKKLNSFFLTYFIEPKCIHLGYNKNYLLLFNIILLLVFNYIYP